MGAAERRALLQELFGTDGNSIGVSYLRLSIGASDLDAQVFSYDDLPAGQTDPTLAKFSLAPERAHLLERRPATEAEGAGLVGPAGAGEGPHAASAASAERAATARGRAKSMRTP